MGERERVTPGTVDRPGQTYKKHGRFSKIPVWVLIPIVLFIIYSIGNTLSGWIPRYEHCYICGNTVDVWCKIEFHHGRNILSTTAAALVNARDGLEPDEHAPVASYTVCPDCLDQLRGNIAWMRQQSIGG